MVSTPAGGGASPLGPPLHTEQLLPVGAVSGSGAAVGEVGAGAGSSAAGGSVSFGRVDPPVGEVGAGSELAPQPLTNRAPSSASALDNVLIE